MDRVDLLTLREKFIKENGGTIRHKEMASTLTRMELSTMVSGIRIYSKDRERKDGQMAQFL
jgi:hypothetical protein